VPSSLLLLCSPGEISIAGWLRTAPSYDGAAAGHHCFGAIVQAREEGLQAVLDFGLGAQARVGGHFCTYKAITAGRGGGCRPPRTSPVGRHRSRATGGGAQGVGRRSVAKRASPFLVAMACPMGDDVDSRAAPGSDRPAAVRRVAGQGSPGGLLDRPKRCSSIDGMVAYPRGMVPER
jgi:hypothetical protein